jgi:hypothetical protein
MVTQELRHLTPSLRKNLVAVCPCCGFKFEGSLANGCESCGALAVGEALPRPDYELPSFGRSLLLAVIGSLLVIAFLTQTVLALVEKTSVSLGFWSLVAAAETAAWRMKWIAIPISVFVVWALRKLYRSVVNDPARFTGLRYARAGFLASLMVPALIVLLIGVTVPARLSQRQDRLAAEHRAPALTFARAQMEYQIKFGTFPSDPMDLTRLPDADGSIAAALRTLDITGYKPSADLAALPTKEPRTLRGSVIMKASIGAATDDLPSESLSFTNYELPLPGPDKVFGTEDDLVVVDGVIWKASDPDLPRSTKKTSARP